MLNNGSKWQLTIKHGINTYSKNIQMKEGLGLKINPRIDVSDSSYVAYNISLNNHMYKQ